MRIASEYGSHNLGASELLNTVVHSPIPSNLERDPAETGIILARIATALFVVFAAIVISSALPPRLLNPAWQLRFVSALVNNGTIAIVGFVLMWLAPVLAPGSGRLRARRDQLATFAVAAALGYLLLIPLQAYAAWNGVQTTNTARAQQLKAATRRIGQLREAINRAGSTAELQTRLRALNGPNLPDQALSRPIAAIRPEILSGLQGAESRLRQQLGGLPGDRVWQLVQESIRVGLSSLAYALAFASGAFLPGQPQSLIDSWLGLFGNSLRRGKASKLAAGRRTNTSHEDYLRELSREKPNDRKS